MKKQYLFVLVCLLYPLSSLAQWTFRPTITLASSGLYYPDDNPYGLTEGGGFVGGLDAEFNYAINDVFSINLGTGLHYTKHVDSLYDGRASWLPIYVGGCLGKELFIEGQIGYNVPIGSSSIGYVHGLFVEVGGGLDFDELLLCLDLGFLNLLGNTDFFYVPAEYVAISSGFYLGVKIKIRFQHKD